MRSERLVTGMVMATFLMAILLVGCGGESGSLKSAVSEATREADIAAIKAMSDARAEAFRQGDSRAIASHFTEDGVLMAPGAPAGRGRDAVQAYYQAIFDEYEAGLESRYDAVDVSGDVAYGQGFAKVTLRPRAGGAQVESTAKYINILRRASDGSWKTTHDIWNANE